MHLYVSQRSQSGRALHAKRLLFLHARVLLQREAQTGTCHWTHGAVETQRSRIHSAEKSLQSLTVMQRGRLIVGIAQTGVDRHQHAHAQWLRLPRSDANAAFSHHVAVAPWVQGVVHRTSGSGECCARAATNEVTRRVVPWYPSTPVTFCGARQWTHQAVGARDAPIRCACFIGTGRIL
jgi:hypothetical protein